MSNNHLKKNAANLALTGTDYTWTPVIVSDSKGKYLKRVAPETVYSKIQWCCKGGATTPDIANFLSKNIAKLVTKHGNLSLYIWSGTCDFTKKEKKFVTLRRPTETTLEKYKHDVRSLKQLCASAKVKVTFLEVPYYSIVDWNKFKGHQSPTDFADDDKLLKELVDAANKFLNELNAETGALTPKLSQHLVRSRKAKGKKQRYSLNLKLLSDGVHPSVNLAKSWLSAICRQIDSDCA